MATFKRYLLYQGMMFVFGIVGPIFLIVFFASQPDPTLKWMYWAGLFVTAADVLIALALTKVNDPKKPPANTRIALAVAKRRQSKSGGDKSRSSSSHDPFSSTSLTFSSRDASSSDSGSSD